ncbi:MAG: hypothetical protein KAX25_04615, partial [Dehalococcoidia bacterium]|nr:hypothetical protein [Dehalococcoidia bacterium]
MMAADGYPTITTDKTKYSLGETMVISGSGFTPDGAVNITVLRPDHETDTLPPVSTDAVGSFQTSYTPPIIPGRYKITATDGIDSAKTAVTEADAGYGLYGFQVKQKGGNGDITYGWSKGNLQKLWAEGEWVPYQFVVTGVQTDWPLLEGLPDMVISYDFTIQGGRFVDLVKNIQIGTQELTDEQGWPDGSGDAFPMTTKGQLWTAQNYAGEHAWNFGNFELAKDQPGWDYETQVNTDLSGGNGTVTDANHKFVVTADQIKSALDGHNDTGTIVLYFQLHLARTFIWSRALESGYDTSPTDAFGGWLYGESMYASDTRLGSGAPQGSRTHVTVDMGVGAKTVPIPIPPMPTGTISGYKWQDDNGNQTKDTAEDFLAGWPIYIMGTVENVQFVDKVLTDGNGTYSFGALTAGEWDIEEQADLPNTTGWSETYPGLGFPSFPITPPVDVGTPIWSVPLPPPYSTEVLGLVAWEVTLTDATPSQGGLNFGNYMGIPDTLVSISADNTTVYS